MNKSGYGTKQLPAGHAWGVAEHESFSSVVAYVVEQSNFSDFTVARITDTPAFANTAAQLT